MIVFIRKSMLTSFKKYISQDIYTREHAYLYPELVYQNSQENLLQKDKHMNYTPQTNFENSESDIFIEE